jgi:hypothetical protein
MKQLPKAIPELDGGLFVPRQVVDLLEAVLDEHGRLIDSRADAADGALVLAQLRDLLRLAGPRPALPPPREQLGLADPQLEMVGRNLLQG